MMYLMRLLFVQSSICVVRPSFLINNYTKLICFCGSFKPTSIAQLNPTAGNSKKLKRLHRLLLALGDWFIIPGLNLKID